MNNDFKIAIPSFKRSKSIKTKTLKYLNQCEIENKNIFIFVSTFLEFKEYKYLTNEGYNIIYTKDLNDLQEKYVFINTFFQEKERVLFIEDDITMLCKKEDTKLKPFYDLKTLYKIGWDAADKDNSKIWGIYPVCNGYFMKDTITRDLKFIPGYLFSTEISKDPDLSPTTAYKHDYERSVLYYKKYNTVTRINFIGQKSSSFSFSGGLQDMKLIYRAKLEIQACEYLVKKYPEFITKSNRFNKILKDYTEIKIKRIKNE